MYETKQHKRDGYSSSSPDSSSRNLNIYLSTPQTDECVCAGVCVNHGWTDGEASLALKQEVYRSTRISFSGDFDP